MMPSWNLLFIMRRFPDLRREIERVIGFYVASAPPERVLHRMDLRNFFFRIPPGASKHEVKRCYTFERDELLLSITPHMHYRAHDVRYELARPDGVTETLLSVPRYDFGWQLVYRFEKPI